MNKKEKLEEATIKALLGKLTEDNQLDKNIESKLDEIYKNLVDEIKRTFPDAVIEDKDWKNQGYKYVTSIKTPSINIKEGVYRYILINIFYNVPSFPTYSYYLGADAEIVESSSNETSVAGLKSSGYKIKNEIPNCKISIKAYAGKDIQDKGQSVTDFVKTINNSYDNLTNHNIKKFI